MGLRPQCSSLTSNRLMCGLEMPIVPVSSAQSLPTTLEAFHHQLVTSAAPEKRPDPASNLLPHCADARTLSEHTIHILTDITTDLKDLIDRATSPEGQQQLMNYLGEDAERLINFWQAEYLVE